MTYEVKFDWPPKVLNPNQKKHWAVKAKAAKSFKNSCFCLAKKAIGQIKTAERLHLFIDFYPPDKRLRDADNCVAMMKSGLDGLADAMQVNDRQFIIHPFIKDDTGGFVKIKIIVGP